MVCIHYLYSFCRLVYYIICLTATVRETQGGQVRSFSFNTNGLRTSSGGQVQSRTSSL